MLLSLVYEHGDVKAYKQKLRFMLLHLKQREVLVLKVSQRQHVCFRIYFDVRVAECTSVLCSYIHLNEILCGVKGWGVLQTYN